MHVEAESGLPVLGSSVKKDRGERWDTVIKGKLAAETSEGSREEWQAMNRISCNDPLLM